MSIAPETIQVGQCYLSDTGQVRRVLRILQDGRVMFTTRIRPPGERTAWNDGVLSLGAFAASVEKPIPCDWTPDTD